MPHASAAISFSRMERMARPWRDFIIIWMSTHETTTVMYTARNVAYLGMLIRPGVPPVRSGRLMMHTRMISPKPSVMMAR